MNEDMTENSKSFTNAPPQGAPTSQHVGLLGNSCHPTSSTPAALRQGDSLLPRQVVLTSRPGCAGHVTLAA